MSGQFIHFVAAAFGYVARPQPRGDAFDARNDRGGRNADDACDASDTAAFPNAGGYARIDARCASLVAVVLPLPLAACAAFEQLNRAMLALANTWTLAAMTEEGNRVGHVPGTQRGGWNCGTGRVLLHVGGNAPCKTAQHARTEAPMAKATVIGNYDPTSAVLKNRKLRWAKRGRSRSGTLPPCPEPQYV